MQLVSLYALIINVQCEFPFLSAQVRGLNRSWPQYADKHCTLFLIPHDRITVKPHICDTQIKLLFTCLQYSALLSQQMRESWQLLSNLNKCEGQYICNSNKQAHKKRLHAKRVMGCTISCTCQPLLSRCYDCTIVEDPLWLCNCGGSFTIAQSWTILYDCTIVDDPLRLHNCGGSFMTAQSWRILYDCTIVAMSMRKVTVTW